MTSKGCGRERRGERERARNLEAAEGTAAERHQNGSPGEAERGEREKANVAGATQKLRGDKGASEGAMVGGLEGGR